MSKWAVKKFILGFLLAGIFIGPAAAEPSWDSERLNLELSMQKRVEETLSKILTPGEFVVVIRVDPLPAIAETPRQSQPDENSGFYLPGVPSRKNYDGSVEKIQTMVESMRPESALFKRFIKRISVILVLDQRLSTEEVDKVRQITRQMVGLDAERGDTLDIQRSDLHKSGLEVLNDSGFLRLQKGLRNYWLLISASLILFCIAVFFLFMFGPLRGFLNHSVQVLSTLKPVEGGRLGGSDIQMLPPMGGGYALPPAMGGGAPAAFSGSLQVENPNRKTLPFGFIREDNLSNLALLLSRETPEKAAVVLGYMPPDWISRVLARMEQNMQTEVASHLATPRQLLPEQVEDIEQDLKRRLDYLIGGPERLFAIYESLDPMAQKRMVDSLRESRPDIAEELRSRTWLFEDLEKLAPAALKALLREIDMQTLVAALKGASDSFKKQVLENVSEGKAEILTQELEVTDGNPTKATYEAQKKIVFVARRLEKEGQIHVPLVNESAPAARYGSLKASLKLPAGMKLSGEEKVADAKEAEVVEPKPDLQERIRRFMSRRSGEKERFPDEGKKE